MARLFISHSGRDNVYALAFQNWLNAQGWDRGDVFIDLHDIGAGQRWRETLRKANAACEAVILLASPDSMGSVECQKELELAEALGKEIVIALLRDITKSDPSLARYRDRQFVNLSEFPQDHIEALNWKGQDHRIGFNPAALEKIKARLDELGIAPESFSWPPKGAVKPEPYPGLAAFSEDEAGIFFGRDADIMAALTEIRLTKRRGSPRLLVIEAASGAGKSSFLRAGLWPRLKRDPQFAPLAILRPAQGILTGPDGLGRRIAPWFERHGAPRAPGAIHAALMREDEAAAFDAFAALIGGAAELAATARRAVAPDALTPSPLISIDQGEELFAAENEAESRRFVAMLVRLLKMPPEGLDPYCLLTIRADSVQSLLASTAELGLDTPKPIYLPPLSPAAYREVILRPAEVYSTRIRRLTIDPALANALVDDAKGADALPLLAFTMSQLFADFHVAGQITVEAYRQMGGIGGSIVRALKQAQVEAGAAGSDAHLRRLLLPRLATWDPEADQQKGAAKRMVASVEDAIGSSRLDLVPLADALVKARLLARGRDTIEVAHEALLRQPPISNWLEDDREFLIWRDRVSKARAAFETNDRGLLIGRELQIARAWLNSQLGDIPAAERSFVTQSIAEEDRRRAEEEEAERQNQARLAEYREKAVRERAKTLQRTFLMFGATVVAVAAMFASFVIHLQQAETELVKAQAQRTEAALLARIAGQLVDSEGRGDAGTGILLALEALPDIGRQIERPYVPEAEAQLDRLTRFLAEKSVLSGHTEGVSDVIFSNDSKNLLTISYDGTACLWSTATGAKLRCLVSHQDEIYAAAYSPDDARIATASADHSVILWNRSTGDIIGQLRGHSGAVYAVTFSPAGDRLATASGDGTVRLWEGKTGREELKLEGHFGEVYSANFAADGQLLLTASQDGTARLWDVSNGREITRYNGHLGPVLTAKFSADARRVLTSSSDGTARLWDSLSAQEIARFEGDGGVHVASFFKNKLIITAGWQDSIVRIWDANSGSEVARLEGHSDGVYGAAFDGNGNRAVTASRDMTVRVWDISTGQEISRLAGSQDEVLSAAFSPDNRIIATASRDNTARLWRVESDSSKLLISQEKGLVSGVFAEDGRTIITKSKDGVEAIWDSDTGKLISRNTLVVRKSLGDTEELSYENDDLDHTSRLIYSNDRKTSLRITTENTVIVSHADSLRELAVLRGHRGNVSSAKFSRDGTRVLTASSDRTSRLWDVATASEIGRLNHHSEIKDAGFSPDGTRIVTTSEDGTVRVWPNYRNTQELVTPQRPIYLDVLPPPNAHYSFCPPMCLHGVTSVNYGPPPSLHPGETCLRSNVSPARQIGPDGA